MWLDLTPTPEGFRALKRARDAVRLAEPAPAPAQPAKPRWARRATRKASFTPELTEPSRVRTDRRYENWNNKLKGL